MWLNMYLMFGEGGKGLGVWVSGRFWGGDGSEDMVGIVECICSVLGGRDQGHGCLEVRWW